MAVVKVNTAEVKARALVFTTSRSTQTC
mgnify:CR=1